MLTIPESVATAARARTGQYAPAMFLDLYAETGPTDSIEKTSRWLGTGDAAAGNDVDVDASRKQGAIVLAAGAPVAAVAAGTDTLFTSMWAVIRRTDKWHNQGTIAKVRGNEYAFDGTTFKTLSNSTSRYRVFSVQSTRILDEIIVPAMYDGAQAMPVQVRVVNAATGNQVGNSVTFTPTTSIVRHTLQGFAAGLVAGRSYRLEFVATPPSTVGTRQGPSTTVTDYRFYVYLYAYIPVDPIWRIHMGSGRYLATGGRPNYKAAGSFHRSADVGEIPTDTGTVSISDVVPSGCSMRIAAYYTDSAVVAAESSITNWTLFANPMLSGAGIPAHRYWRFVVTMGSNAAQDLTPALHAIRIQFTPPPLTIGTTGERRTERLPNGIDLPLLLPLRWQVINRLLQSGYRALNSVSASSAQLSPQFAGSMTGTVTATLAPEPIVHDLVSKPLRGRRADFRAGYVGIDETIHLYSGSVNELSFSNNVYRLDTADNFQIADVSIPAEKAGAEWGTNVSYAVNDVIIHGSSSYICVSAHTSSSSTEPGVGGTWTSVWDLKGAVWATIDYTAVTNSGFDWHAADAILDILTNQINIPAERLDFTAIAAVKALHPNRTVSRLITKPTKATAMLGELAWLLEAQFVVREGLFSIVSEPASTANLVEHIRPNDIAPNTLRFRRGWREMVNEGVIFTGYTGDGEGSDKFTQGEVLVDVPSQVHYNTVVQKTWEDKWGTPKAELQARLATMLAKYSDGRRVYGCTVAMRLLAVEPGDVVTLSSGQLPPGAAGPVKCLIISKKLDFAKQTLVLEMLEAL